MSHPRGRPDPAPEPGRAAISRRSMLRAGTAVTGSALLAGAVAETPVHAAPRTVAGAVRPPALRPGDRVRVVSPGSTPDPVNMARGIEILRGWGLQVELAPHVYTKYGYLAGTDAERIADLNAALNDPGVRGVFAARGGYGTQRIVDRIDASKLRRDPRVVVGFSDITSIHGKLWRDAGLVTFYGPMVNWTDSRTGPESAEALRRAVMTTNPITITRDPAETTASVLVPGRASGRLLGGCLTLISTSLGAKDSPDFDGALLFFEDTNEVPSSIDMMLTELRRLGIMSRVAGVVVGQITDSVGEPDEWDAVAVLKDRLYDLGVPVLGGLPLGHGNGQLTIPLGTHATIDAQAGTLTVTPGVRPR
ncbi:S66 peptidase family protein [Micromonospora polyrhachis]|uniref:Muramoyltetrapeptide carboxypeptidase n=1 Tax=Micromonospora polyrhachis TaxID=1282883 RepID=A0A7W7SPX9_9ACTN|nr:LD-carboxypeptidase [Micromonospora polyrhachis]MBB4958793.1 muramoyltetrapeptide carboxypeptidase [Micromonospora polyrhachis]